MKIKIHPVQYLFALYIIVSAYLIYASFSIQQYLSGIQVVNLAPFAYAILAASGIILVLSLFSLFRIPIFHYLFKMIHLWVLMLCGIALLLYFKYGQLLPNTINAELPKTISNVFPGTQPVIFEPFVKLVQMATGHLKPSLITLFSTVAIILAVIQIFLYLPSSLRYVYYSHISPIKYPLKHILISLLLFVPFAFISLYLFKQDTSLNPKLETLLTFKQQQIKDKNNAFYPMLTQWLPGVTDRIAYGKAWLADFRKMQIYFKQQNIPVKPSQYPNYNRLNLGGMSKADQGTINQLYIKKLINTDPDIDKEITGFLNKYQTPLQTTHLIMLSKRYENPIQNSQLSYTVFYKGYTDSFLSLLRLKLISNLVGPGKDIDTIVKNIRDEYYFDLRVIQFSKDPKVKLLYIKKQAIIAQFLYNLLDIQKYQNNKLYKLINHIPVLTKVVMDQRLIARNTLELHKNDLVQANQKLSNMHSSDGNFIRYTYKYHKTLNCIFDRARTKYNLGDLDISTYIQHLKPINTKASLDNAIGYAICQKSISDNEDDIFIKSVETNGKIMILKARSKILENKIDIFNISTYLNNHSNQYFNPFTSSPLKWNSDMHQIYFDYNNGNKKIRVSY